MKVVSHSACQPEPISNYESHGAVAARLADGYGEAHAYVLQFEPGGAIGRHEAGYGQLFLVVDGRGWVAGDDGVRAEVGAGDFVLFARGEQHSKGSQSGMTAVMVQVRDLEPFSDTGRAALAPAVAHRSRHRWWRSSWLSRAAWRV